MTRLASTSAPIRAASGSSARKETAIESDEGADSTLILCAILGSAAGVKASRRAGRIDTASTVLGLFTLCRMSVGKGGRSDPPILEFVVDIRAVDLYRLG